MIKFYRIFLLAALIFSSVVASAQPGGGRPCPRPPCPPPIVPITGIEYLIGIGGLYGLGKLMNRSKKDKKS